MKKKVLISSAFLILLFGAPGALWVLERARPRQTGEVLTGVQTVLSPLRRLVAWSSGRLSDGLEYLVTTGEVRRRNTLLAEEVARLRAMNSALREALAKYERLDKVASLTEGREWEFLPADVVAYGNRPWIRSLEVNRGRGDGDKCVLIKFNRWFQSVFCGRQCLVIWFDVKLRKPSTQNG